MRHEYRLLTPRYLTMDLQNTKYQFQDIVLCNIIIVINSIIMSCCKCFNFAQGLRNHGIRNHSY